MKNILQKASFLFFLTASLLVTGCTDLTQATVTPLNDTIHPNKGVCSQRGHIYTMRGWLGIFSIGMNRLAKKTQKELGICSTAVAYTEAKMLSEFLIAANKSGQLPRPLILIGHSYGADNQILVAQALNKAHVPIDLLVTLDPVTPDLIPPNVRYALNIYKSHPQTDKVPILRGMPVIAVNSAETTVENINLRPILPKEAGDTTHFNIDDNLYAQKIIYREIRMISREYDDEN